MLIGILITTLAGAVCGLVHWSPETYRVSDIAATAGKLDIRAAWNLGFFEIVSVFLFVDLFDNVGTLVGVGKKAGCSTIITAFRESAEFFSPTQPPPSPDRSPEPRP